ncbi:hypothetical protein ACJIZ3_019857 [Penstemon smallii]|uniref:Uncharacterized protein n=1 Tax=Penstemon smallii TaxID=265156 RepID=A0ABD3T3B3_9LAMI
MTTIIPSFDTPKLFPGKNLVNSLNYSNTRTPNPEIIFKKFLFSNESITNLRATNNEPVSRVRIVCALIAKALIGVDKIKQGGKSRTCLIAQAVNIRPRTNPQLPKHLCGNLAMQAVLCINEENKTDHEELEFQDLVRLLGEATHKTIKDCEEILFSKGGDIFDNSTLSMHDFIANGDVNCLWFSDWSKFGFYEADFGWGKPTWASVANMYAENLVILMENREGGTGGGIEAFVHLHENYVSHFEQDEGIRSFSY